MRRSCVFALFALVLLVCNGVVMAVNPDQNAIVTSDSKRVVRSLRTDASDDDKKRRFLVADATTEELTPKEEERGKKGGGGGGRGRSRSRSRKSSGGSSASVMSKIRNWFRGLFNKKKTSDQANKKDKKRVTGVNYWNTRSIGYASYYFGDHSRDKDK
ncbi:hypothetical protein PHYBOEH_007762 [Phytophthora boehmeriae]|uniref:RxLR effector protein n=1 Tax=Phytophthora boehmeriae TaxID=109152 RepID=A0A8T1WAL6_9STRA|nr:hypothetical protein PHYBOEH_007762 [Phytophthora boehmeriae]